MTEKAQFCHSALIDQIDQWQKSLEADLKVMKQIKERVVSTEDQAMIDRIWVNKNVVSVIDQIQKEFLVYRNERVQAQKGHNEFLSIIKKYEQLQDSFQKINQEIRSIYSYSQEYYSLKEDQTKKQLNTEFLSLRREHLQDNLRDTDYKYSSVAEGLKYNLSEKYGKRGDDIIYIDEDYDHQGEEQRVPQSNVSFLNDTFNSQQNRQISLQQIEDIKQRSSKQIAVKSQPYLQQTVPSKSILKERKMIDFIDNIQSEWFGDLQKSYLLQGGSAKTCTNQAQTAKFSQKENPNLSQVVSRSKTPKHKRSMSQNAKLLERQNITTQKSQLNYSFRQKQEENSSALYILKRELLRIKELVQEQVTHYDEHSHNNIDEEIKKYKLENTLMKTQCQILKDENQELLIEFQKTKKILEDQIMLSKELQDKLYEQKSQRYHSQLDSDDFQYNEIDYPRDERDDYKQRDFFKKEQQYTSQQTDYEQNAKSTNRLINQQIANNLNEEMLASWVKKRIDNSNGKYHQDSLSDC